MQGFAIVVPLVIILFSPLTAAFFQVMPEKEMYEPGDLESGAAWEAKVRQVFAGNEGILGQFDELLREVRADTKGETGWFIGAQWGGKTGREALPSASG